MILPLFDYSGMLLLSCNKTDKEDLQIIQNNVLRLCLGFRLKDRISLDVIYKKANLVGLEQRRCIQTLSLLYSHGESNANTFVIPARNTRAANRRKFKTEKYENAKYKNSPYYRAAKLWDTLPDQIRDSSSLGELKKHLKALYSVFDENKFLL